MAHARRRRLSVRLTSVLAALLVMIVYGFLTHSHNRGPLPLPRIPSDVHEYSAHEYSLDTTLNPGSIQTEARDRRRHLLSYSEESFYSDGGLFGNSSRGNVSGCNTPLHPPAAYGGDRCQYVRDHCSGNAVLIDYLSFIMCDMRHVKVREWTVYCECK